MGELSLDVIRFCAEECARQESGELSVYRMCHAWSELFEDSDEKPRRTWLEAVLHVAKIVEPEKNANGFRHQPVTVRGNVIPIRDFDRLLLRLCGGAAIFQITPEEWYREFEEIHPFNDGNGRVGAIFYNYLGGLDDGKPRTPPDFWSEASP